MVKSASEEATLNFVEGGAALKGGVAQDRVDFSFIFHIITSHQMTAESDITDHYIEDGSALQDHITLKPLQFTLRGFCAEKVYVDQVPPITDKIKSNLSKLQPVSTLLPAVSSYCQTVVAASSYVETVVNKYVNMFNDVKDKVKLLKTGMRPAAEITNQEIVANSLLKLRNSRILGQLTTPWGVYENMVLQSVQLVQEETTSQSEIIVELKQIRTANSILTDVDVKRYQSRVAQQRATSQDLGNIQGVVKESVLHEMLHGGGTAIQNLLRSLLGG